MKSSLVPTVAAILLATLLAIQLIHERSNRGLLETQLMLAKFDLERAKHQLQLCGETAYRLRRGEVE
jgi:hypothetical protein